MHLEASLITYFGYSLGLGHSISAFGFWILPQPGNNRPEGNHDPEEAIVTTRRVQTKEPVTRKRCRFDGFLLA